MLDMRLGPHGHALWDEFEPSPKSSANGTKAFRCPGGRWTLAKGVTEWPDGRQVGPHEICTEEQAEQLNAWAIKKYEDIVNRVIREPLTQNQFDACVMMAFNTGPQGFADSTVAQLLNLEKRPSTQVIAAAFGKWCFATSSNPEESDLDKAYYIPIIGTDEKGNHIWVDAQGQRTRYFRAFPGLLRRHLSEACLFLNLDWRQACRKDTVSIASDRIWDARENRWEDRVRTKTELADVLPTAKQHPLSDAALKAPAEIVESPKLAKPSSPKSSAGAYVEEAEGFLADKPKGPAPPVGTKPPSPNSKPLDKVPYGVDPKLGAKPIEESARVDANMIQKLGRAGIRGVALGWLGGGGTAIGSFIEKEPLFMDLYLMVLLLGVSTVVALGIKSYGNWKRKRAEAEATQLLY